MRSTGFITLTLLTAAGLASAQGVISTVAGNGTNATAGDGGLAISASLHPNGVTLDSAGNIYIADLAKNVVRKVDAITGIITTVAGNGSGSTVFANDNGPAINSPLYMSFNHNGLAVDDAGNLYIADDGHHRIRKVDVTGKITTFAGNGKQGFSGDGGAATSAMLYRPSGVAVDHSGNVYIADSYNSRVRKVDASGTITTVAGNGAIASTGDGGPALSASFFQPTGIAVDGVGNIYIADYDSSNVRKVNAAGIITAFAGTGSGATGFSGDGGPAVSALFGSPTGVAVDNAGNVYIADGHRIRKVDTAGIVHTIAGIGGASGPGDGGPPTSANMNAADVAVDAAGNYYIADVGNNRIRKITIGARVPGLSVTANSLYFSSAASGNSPNAQLVTIYTTGAVPLNFTGVATTASNGSWLTATINGGLTPTTITVFPNVFLPVGSYKASVVLTPAAPDLPVVTIPVTYDVIATPPARPAIMTNGVVNGASFVPGVAANSLATIYGTNLATVVDTWDKSIASGILPTSLDGVTVQFDGLPAYLTYISPTQINLLVPDVRGSTTSVLVTNSGIKLLNLSNVPAAKYGPAFFPWPGNQPVATRTDYSYAVKNGTFAGLTTVAAKPGDILILWGTGFGPTTPAYPVGYPVPTDTTYSTATAPTVTINNIQATVYGAALASGYAGLYQVAIQVPTTLADGDWPIVASIGGVSSPGGIVLSVKH